MMHWAALTLLALGVLVMALAIHGRVVARGRFCRKCRFDLAGLGAEQGACPECGRDLTGPGSTRAALRRRSRWLAAASALLLGVSAAWVLVGVTGASGLYRRMPDAAVLRLADLGVDEALTELHARFTAPSMLAEQVWTPLVERALDRQADPGRPWDPRWGDALAEAMLSGRMSDEQTERYLRNALAVQMHARDRVPHGAASLPIHLECVGPRAVSSDQAAMTVGSAYGLTLRITDAGRDDPDRERQDGGAVINGFYLPTPRRADMSVGMRTRVPIDPPAWENAAIGDRVPLFVEYRLILTRHADGREWTTEPRRIDASPTVIGPDEPLVSSIVDAQRADAVARGAWAGPLRIRIEDVDQDRTWRQSGLFHDVDMPGGAPLAGRLYLRENGVETEVATIAGGPAPRFSGSTRSIHRDQAPAIRSLFQRCLDRGRVDLVFRSDPAVAADFPRLDSVLQVDLLFPGVPVHPLDEQGNWPDDQTRIPAVPLPADLSPPVSETVGG